MASKLEFSRNLCVSTNASCNLNCVYCYEKRKKNASFDVDKAISIIQKMLQTKTSEGTKIKLHGGEPFLVFPKIKQLCESIWKSEYPEYYNFHITTNGTLIHDNIQNWLSDHRDQITLKLSLDGNRNSHDMNRPDSFDKIDIPFFLKNWPDIRVNMTVSPMTLPHLAENISFLHSQGFLHINVTFALLTDWSKYKLERVLYRQLQKVSDYYLENSNLIPMSLFQIDISRTIIDNVYYAPCNIGKKTAFDFETEQYYPCHLFFPSVCGSQISDKLMATDFTKRDLFIDSACKDCPFINICRTCYAENYMLRGNLASRDMGMCSYQKAVFVSLFNYEYQRILNLKAPTSDDFRKMKAIQKWQHTIREIENTLTCD